jgi:hypothetical protein
MGMPRVGLYTLHIQELTATIPDTTINIQDIPVTIIIMDINMGTIDFTINQVDSTAALTSEIQGRPIMGVGIFTMGLKVCTGVGIKDYGIRIVVIRMAGVEDDKRQRTLSPINNKSLHKKAVAIDFNPPI